MTAAVLVLTSLAALPRVTEQQSGLSFQIPATTPCVHVPRLGGPDECPAVDRAKLQAVGQDVWLFASSVDGRVTLVANRIDMTSPASMSADAIDRFVAGVIDAASSLGLTGGGHFAAKLHEGRRYWLNTNNGFTNVRFELEPDLRAQKDTGQVNLMAGAMIPFESYAVVIMHTSLGAGRDDALDELVRSLEPTGKTLRPNTGLLGTEGAFRFGRVLGRLMCSLGCLAVLLWGAVRLWRASKEAAANANAAPPPPPPPPAPPPAAPPPS